MTEIDSDQKQIIVLFSAQDPSDIIQLPDLQTGLEDTSNITILSSSTKAIVKNASLNYSTDDTLNMITSPWSTESWISDSIGTGTASSSSKSCYLSSCLSLWSCYQVTTVSLPSVVTDSTSTSIRPKSSTSYGVSILDINSDVTTCNYASAIAPSLDFSESDRKSESATPITNLSFIAASFYANGAVKVKYPWSPRSELSLASSETAYPESLDSCTLSNKSSWATMTPTSAKKIQVIDTFAYVVRQSENKILDWMFANPRTFMTYPELVNTAV